MDINVSENQEIYSEQIEKKTKDKSNKKVYKIMKRMIDIVLSTIGLIILSPLFLIVAIVIKIDSKGPVFFNQVRFGKNGIEFKMYKFRTMCLDADEKLKEFLEKNEEAKREYNQYKKLNDDPRITKFGKVLRALSIDEIPQLLNILIGNMSIVGPRPYLPREKEDMGNKFEKIIQAKPGLTRIMAS